MLAGFLFIECQTPKKKESSLKQLENLIDQYAEEILQNGNINSIAVAIYKEGTRY